MLRIFNKEQSVEAYILLTKKWQLNGNFFREFTEWLDSIDNKSHARDFLRWYFFEVRLMKFVYRAMLRNVLLSVFINFRMKENEMFFFFVCMYVLYVCVVCVPAQCCVSNFTLNFLIRKRKHLYDMNLLIMFTRWYVINLLSYFLSRGKWNINYLIRRYHGTLRNGR
jgi:hypothetical protein